ncbi:MAG: hypothetical protein QXO02_08560 [Thermofilaceae archaeon]
MNSTDAILTFIIGQLAWIMYKVGRLEAQVAALKRRVEDLYTLLNSKSG